MIHRCYYLFFILLSFQLFSQEERVICWNDDIDVFKQDSIVTLLDFKNAITNNSIGNNRIYFEKIPIPHRNFELEVYDFQYVDILDSELYKIAQDNLSDTVRHEYFIGSERKQHDVFFYLEPFRKVNNSIQSLSQFKIKLNELNHLTESNFYVENSVLSTGNWYKIAVSETGLHRIDTDFLNSMGVDPLYVNPQSIRIYGNKSGMLREGVMEVDDLQELAISVIGEDDGSFDQDDFILFYGQNQNTWRYDDNQFIHQKNIYSDKTYYFICFDLGDGKRIDTLSTASDDFQNAVSRYDEYFFYEKDLFNLVNTGRQWFGNSFGYYASQSFNVPAIDWDNNSILFTARVAARSSMSSSFSINNGFNIGAISLPSVSLSGDYYKSTLFQQICQWNESNTSVTFNYNNNGNTAADAWLDYFTIQGRAEIRYNGMGQYLFRDIQSVSQDSVTTFKVSSLLQSICVWDVTDPINVQKLTLTQNNQAFYFKTETSILKEFLVFNNVDQAMNTPQFIEMVPNQNIHGFDSPTYIIVTHPDFLDSANILADYHRTNNNENVLVVTTQQVYNEFSTGSQDVSAIRNLVKMFYDRAEDNESPNNLLLFGDASFDYKNILNLNNNFVPTYQSWKSSNIENSYCTDDYFGVLDDDEGAWDGSVSFFSQDPELIDIGIGRIPVSSSIEAEHFVQKVMTYNDLNSGGDWKNNLCFVADDTDDESGWEDILISDADFLAQFADSLYPQFNLNKIYLDSYQQSISSGSQRYPDAQDDLRTQIEQGALIITYVGHGGEIGLASERVLELADINSFTNINNLPVFVTATCEFTRYDDPTRVSAGEQLILNPNGGAIALYSTSRTVGAVSAGNLVKALYNYLPDKTQDYTFGEALCETKNDPSAVNNVIKRKFSLFGDPNLKLAHPKLNIKTSSIVLLDALGQEIIVPENTTNDTIKALSHVRIYGEVLDENNVLIDFSGDLYATVFDKKSTFLTLNNDGVLDEPFEYELQKNIIYKGAVNVFNGYFNFEFIVPKDISYQYDSGKISYYAIDSINGDASGFDKDIIIGGINDDFMIDLEGPEIQLFMNDTNFISGGYTNTEPELLAILFDESGINTVGTGIGHDLIAVLDDDVSGQYILNNYYDADFNSFQSGKVRYPFYDLSDGEHTLYLRAWDVHNNSSNEEITFFVTSSSQLAIEYLLNYPNPASSFTRFVFEHNRPEEEIDVTLDIFSLTGALVKRISTTIFATGFREKSISWDIDSSVDSGIYIYRLSAKSKNDDTISQKTEKLIIVR